MCSHLFHSKSVSSPQQNQPCIAAQTTIVYSTMTMTIVLYDDGLLRFLSDQVRNLATIDSSAQRICLCHLARYSPTRTSAVDGSSSSIVESSNQNLRRLLSVRNVLRRTRNPTVRHSRLQRSSSPSHLRISIRCQRLFAVRSLPKPILFEKLAIQRSCASSTRFIDDIHDVHQRSDSSAHVNQSKSIGASVDSIRIENDPSGRIHRTTHG